MKKLLIMVSAIVVLSAFVIGCAGQVSKETKVKCPKCGAVFTVDEGIKRYQSETPSAGGGAGR